MKKFSNSRKEEAQKTVQFLRSLTLGPVPMKEICTYTFNEIRTEESIQEGIRTGRYEVLAVDVDAGHVILECA